MLHYYNGVHYDLLVPKEPMEVDVPPGFVSNFVRTAIDTALELVEDWPQAQWALRAVGPKRSHTARACPGLNC